MNPKRIIIDTDPGIDDALAILLALASPELQIEGLTIINGNCSVDQGVQNALSILELAGAEHIPVARGCEFPLVQPLLLAAETHGETGIGYAHLPPPKIKPIESHAIDFIIEKVLQNPGEITIVALGPLTNIAMAIRYEPKIISKIQAIYIMGGAIQFGGNTTPLAEFNTFADPHAAHIVYHSGLPITLIPLDVTYQVIITQNHIKRLLQLPTEIPQFIADATRFYMEFHDEYQKIDGCVINDPLALATCFNPSFVELYDYYVDVDISGGVSMGKTFADFFHQEKKSPNMKVAMKVSANDFIEFFLTRIKNLCENLNQESQTT